MRPLWPEKAGFLTGALFISVFVPSLHAWEAASTTTVGDMRVSFSAASVLPVPEHGRRSTPAEDEAAPHRIAVRLAERETGRPISEAQVDVIITSGDYASGPLPMRRTSSRGRVYFEIVGPHLPRAALYQVDVRLAASPAATSVHFDYRHGR